MLVIWRRIFFIIHCRSCKASVLMIINRSFQKDSNLQFYQFKTTVYKSEVLWRFFFIYVIWKHCILVAMLYENLTWLTEASCQWQCHNFSFSSVSFVCFVSSCMFLAVITIRSCDRCVSFAPIGLNGYKYSVHFVTWIWCSSTPHM